MSHYIIRELAPHERSVLREFLYEAIFQKEGTPSLPREIVRQPELRIYYEDFGKAGDHCVVAEADDQIVGAAWTRLFSGDIKGYGSVDDQTPELAISLYPDYRTLGIGTALLNSLLNLLKDKEYQQVSLAVQKDNYCVGMYQKAGFTVAKDLEDDYIMILKY